LSTNGTGTLAFSSFATLVSNTFTGSQTLSGGTANGVTYLNGSKVLTSGSALTFDGTNLGIGNSLSGIGGYVVVNAGGTGSSGLFRVNYNGTNVGQFYTDSSSNLYVENVVAGKPVIFSTSSGEGMRLTSTGLGIGTSSPSSKLDVSGSGVIATLTGTGVTSYLKMTNTGQTSANGFQVQTVNEDVYVVNYSTAGNIFFSTNGSSNNDMTIDSSGSLLVGTTTVPTTGGLARGIVSVKQLNDTSQTSGIQIEANANTNVLGLGYNGSTFAIGTTYRSTGSYVPISFFTSGSERARILSDGDFLFGTTSSPFSSGVGSAFSVQSNGRAVLVMRTNSTSTSTLCDFGNPNSTIGTIQVSGTSTSFNTSSDYRLKEDVQPMTGALAKVVQLKPVTYKWKTDGTDGQGFIAHELAEVVPQCVTGEKDAINADGKPIHQGVDTSFLVATLTAAIQELKADFDAYKASHP
jgi:hypothetical protein